jgi:hypothetical protein
VPLEGPTFADRAIQIVHVLFLAERIAGERRRSPGN